MSEQLLEGAVEVFALLDRDYRSDPECKAVKDKLSRLGVHCHIWKRKELESYLLQPSAIARLTGADEQWLEEASAEAAEEAEEHVFAQMTARAIRRFPHDQQTQAITQARTLFKEAWADRATRKWLAPPERVLHGLNRRLTKVDHDPTSFAALARHMHEDEVPDEMTRFLGRVEEALELAGVAALA